MFFKYLGEVPVVGGLAEVQLFALIVGQHPWEHGVLVEVIVSASWG